MACSVDGCEREVWATALCGMHYQRKRTKGDPGPGERIGNWMLPPEERFWAGFDLDEEMGCWVWRTPDSLGYGVIRVSRRKTKAHRFAYELLEGPIPDGLTIDHLCRNRACVNPGHLEPVTMIENTMRGYGLGVRNAAKTHCPQGHPYSGPNLKLAAGGRRRLCRACLSRMRHERYLRLGR